MNAPEHTKGIIDFTEETAGANGRERKIEKQVYALVGLTPEGIKIVEEAQKR